MKIHPQPWFRRKAIKYALERIDDQDSYILIGMPGIGKSLFLRTLHRNLSQTPHVCSYYIDLNELQQISDQTITQFIADQLDDSTAKPSLIKVARKLKSQKEKHVVIIDRFEKATYRVSHDFFDTLRVVIEKSNSQVIFILSLFRDILDLFDIREIDQFYSLINPFTYYLQPFEKKEGIEYLRYISEKRDLKFKKKELGTIFEVTGGHKRMGNAYISHIDAVSRNQSFNKQLERANASFGVEYQCRRILEHINRQYEDTLIRIAMDLPLYKQDEHNIEYLKEVGLVNNDGAIFSVRLDQYLSAITKAKRPGLYLDENTGEMFKLGERIDMDLSPYEYRFLEFLYENAEQVVDREEVVEAVWGVPKEQGVSDEAVDQLVSRLRDKIEDNKGKPRYLVTVRGRGFQLKLD